MVCVALLNACQTGPSPEPLSEAPDAAPTPSVATASAQPATVANSSSSKNSVPPKTAAPPTEPTLTRPAGGTPGLKDTTDTSPPPPGGQAAKSEFNPAQMQSAVRNFADLYRQTMASACDQILALADDNPDLRRLAQTTKIDGATAMYDIAVDPVPASAMLNAAVLVSLQYNFVKVHGPDLFGEHAPMLIERGAYLQEEIFRICARTMPNDKRAELLKLINQWSAENPDVADFWYIRLSDLPGVQQGLSVNDLVGSLTNLPSKFLNVFNPFAATGQSVTDAQALAERMSWLAPRLMILAQWRAEAVVYDSIANTRLTEALDLGNRFAAVAEDLPETISAQREALVEDLQENDESLNQLLTNTTQLSEAANALFATLSQITGQVENIQATAIANRKPTNPHAEPGRPFDITEYTAALSELQAVVVDANALLLNANDVTSGDALNDRIDVVESTIRHLILTAALALLVVGVLLIVAVKFIPRRREPTSR